MRLARPVAAWGANVSLKLRLTVMNFLQFFIWGAWLITIGAYWFQNKQWSGTSFGAIFSTMGISALFMPALMGVVADKWINAEKLYGALHILGGVFLCLLPMATDPHQFFWLILATMPISEGMNSAEIPIVEKIAPKLVPDQPRFSNQ